jgi:hypothetical protein
MAKIKLATTWLDGCSGCHMSLLDLDEGLITLAGQMEIVYGPLVDYKTFPDHADVALVEGAVSSEADKKNIVGIRARSGLLVSFGDCAVTANVPGMRNRFPVEALLQRGGKPAGRRSRTCRNFAAALGRCMNLSTLMSFYPDARPLPRRFFISSPNSWPAVFPTCRAGQGLEHSTLEIFFCAFPAEKYLVKVLVPSRGIIKNPFLGA